MLSGAKHLPNTLLSLKGSYEEGTDQPSHSTGPETEVHRE